MDKNSNKNKARIIFEVLIVILISTTIVLAVHSIGDKSNISDSKLKVENIDEKIR